MLPRSSFSNVTKYLLALEIINPSTPGVYELKGQTLEHYSFNPNEGNCTFLAPTIELSIISSDD